MTQQAVDELAHSFEAARPRLERIAYAVLGERGEAEDVVQETWLRLAGAAAEGEVRDVVGWCTVAVSRRAVDVLRSARHRREQYVGPWLPEPVLAAPPGGEGADPAEQVVLAETVAFALMVVLESLTPAERTAWVLHDVFGLPFPEVATAVGRSPEAVRRLASRARAHIGEGAPRLDVAQEEHRRVTAAFGAAVATGDLHHLLEVLDPAVVLTSDGGGEVSAARRPVLGDDAVARFVLGIAGRRSPTEVVQPVLVNSGPGFVAHDGGRVTLVVALAVSGGRVVRVDIVRAPSKLARVRLPG
ncbi:RNA polymerase sigma-70 factor (ECF subfamily) [Kineococcus xinjiangensis]|uniref:RNA polymerase sigma-70 factor (ECF subfamily) n=1 Tax=Kineococcus xinjiangensis TaxID=512762 RepID=A0A2S6IDX9_9ACTN|nr:RNA polymerase sigma factor SigJ [Kineococcus xinjiangensis]PPK92422.1 RNA polymerase sigma-70 factor (ECF subfamily) [Kineococcus xinjiangensis]